MMKQCASITMAVLLAVGVLVMPLKADGPKFSVLDSYWGTVGNPVEVLAGEANNQLVISIRYVGEEQISNPGLTITLPPGFRNSTGGRVTTSAYVGSVPYGGRMDFVSRVTIGSEASPGVHLCDATIEWAKYTTRYDSTSKQFVSDFAGIWRDNITVPIYLYERTILDLTVSPDYIVAGRTANITLCLSNVGEVNVSNLDLTVSLGSGLALVGTDNKFYVGSVSGGSSTVVNLKVFSASALAGTMGQMTIAMSYRTGYGFTKSETRTITLPVRGYSEAQVVNAVALSSYTSKFTISGTMANTGMVTLRTVTLTLKTSEYFSVTSPTFVGDVSVGAQAPYTLQVIGTSITNGTYPLTFIVNYKDDFGIPSSISQTLHVDFTVKAPPSSGQTGPSVNPQFPGGSTIVGILVPLVVGFGIGYLVFGRKKKEATE